MGSRLIFLALALVLWLGSGAGVSAQAPVIDDAATLGGNQDSYEQVEVAERRKILVMIAQPLNRLRPGSSYSSGYGSAQSKAARARLGRQIADDNGAHFVELWPMPLIGLDCFIIELRDGVTAAEAIVTIEQHPMVEWAEPMELYEGQASNTRDDPLSKLAPSSTVWNMSRVHSSWTGRGVKVAVIDTQIDVNHPDLAGRVGVIQNFAPQAPPRPELHGTEVAGIVAANARNGIGIAGIAPEARLMALRACWQRGASRSSTCTSLNLARAMNYAIENGAKIINLSLGGPPNRLLTRLIDAAAARNIAVVAAYNPKLPAGGFPASYPKVIAVSQIGGSPQALYAAPGKDIPTTQPNGRFNFVTGSSYSAAHITGLLALRYERARSDKGKSTRQWHSLMRIDDASRKIDIVASFE